MTDTRALLQIVMVATLLPTVFIAPSDSVGDESTRPNVLLITIDDLNDWVGCLRGHPQSLTPNIDTLVHSPTTFRRFELRDEFLGQLIPAKPACPLQAGACVAIRTYLARYTNTIFM